ncbi:hypothetical protein PHLGIDRAFT_125957 [Phlebiopsis gigantea 11061_1 CR5-6]|uniref:Uncharacterized protein n=1 Tax=Phlebiopsis gigantea (strain 11061_1 CR5-6) TaxID=745531 RepID=A0A0C3SB77_PHLG1|nr:hypothetical protein PHLGIDRAFT_125957 [Phlebiopsis gigantea 11061_1 CR5-6]
MLHLDQNHSSLSSPHSKPSVILSNTPRPDQHNLLSWSAPNRDERPPFFQEPHEHPVADKPFTPPIKPDAPAANTEAPTAATGPIAPGNAEDPKLSDQPPSTPDATSPALESTSSLTPPPSATSPAFSSVELPDGEPSTQQRVEGTEEEEQAKVDSGDNASRASTPLSELSSAPGADDVPPTEKKPENEGQKPAVDGAEATRASVNPAPKGGENQAILVSAETSNANDLFPRVDQRLGSTSRAPSIATPEPTAIPASTSGSSKKSDPKVEVLIELNSELLRVCMELQTRGVTINDPKAQHYSTRLQSNLTWMAAAVDQHRTSSVHSIPLPVLQPPPPLDFMSVDRIQQLYEELPKLFAKEIKRRRDMNGPSALGLAPSNGHLKRDRPDDISADLVGANKRRDTGGSKTSTPTPSTPLGISSPIQPISATMTQPGTPTHRISTPNLMGPSGSSPSMPPPSIPPGMMAPGNEAQLAAQRTRQMQLRQMQQQQAMTDGSRQMSSGQVGMSMPGSSSIPPGTLAALQAMGPTAVQCFQILQNPQHPLVQYMTANSPGFQTLPPQQQIQQMQRVQMMMQARSQQQRAANGQMAAMQGMPQVSGGSGGMGVPNGSPTRISAGGQQSHMQQGYPFPGSNNGPGSMDPRTSSLMGSLTPAQQASIANMTPQQRQLFLLQQQQQMMRGGNPANPMMNQQVFNPAQQQRMPGSSPHIGSPMLGGSPDGANFPAALRSNPGVPGIARSARTPSDHAPSPITPQLSQRGSTSMDDFQRSMMQQAQRNIAQGGGMNQLAMGNAGWAQSQQNPMTPNQASFGAMSPPGSATGYGGSPSIGGQQQWSPNANASFQFNTGSPLGNPSADLMAPGSRQASATPAPQQMAQNSPLPGGDQTGMNDFDLFDWGQ